MVFVVSMLVSMGAPAILLDYTLPPQAPLPEFPMSASLLPPRSAEVADIMKATMQVFRVA